MGMLDLACWIRLGRNGIYHAGTNLITYKSYIYLLILFVFFFFFKCYGTPRILPSSPTRRSSDLRFGAAPLLLSSSTYCFSACRRYSRNHGSVRRPPFRLGPLVAPNSLIVGNSSAWKCVSMIA